MNDHLIRRREPTFTSQNLPITKEQIAKVCKHVRRYARRPTYGNGIIASAKKASREVAH